MNKYVISYMIMLGCMMYTTPAHSMTTRLFRQTGTGVNQGGGITSQTQQAYSRVGVPSQPARRQYAQQPTQPKRTWLGKMLWGESSEAPHSTPVQAPGPKEGVYPVQSMPQATSSIEQPPAEMKLLSAPVELKRLVAPAERRQSTAIGDTDMYQKTPLRAYPADEKEYYWRNFISMSNKQKSEEMARENRAALKKRLKSVNAALSRVSGVTPADAYPEKDPYWIDYASMSSEEKLQRTVEANKKELEKRPESALYTGDYSPAKVPGTDEGFGWHVRDRDDMVQLFEQAVMLDQKNALERRIAAADKRTHEYHILVNQLDMLNQKLERSRRATPFMYPSKSGRWSEEAEKRKNKEY